MASALTASLGTLRRRSSWSDTDLRGPEITRFWRALCGSLRLVNGRLAHSNYYLSLVIHKCGIFSLTLGAQLLISIAAKKPSTKILCDVTFAASHRTIVTSYCI